MATSCSTIEKIDRKGKDKILDASNLPLITGAYSNAHQLLDILKQRESAPKYIKDDSALKVIMTAVDDRTVKLEFSNHNKLLYSKTLKGKIDKGYFKAKPKAVLSLEPLFPILWGPGVYNLSLGLTQDNDLVVLESHTGIALVTFLPLFAGGGERDVVLKRDGLDKSKTGQ